MRLISHVGIVLLSVSQAALAQSANKGKPASSEPVTVVNTATNPVPVTAPAPLPVTGAVSITGSAVVETTPRESVDLAGYATNSASYGGYCSVPLFEVPSGKRLVVELVTGFAEIQQTTAPYQYVYISNGATVHNTITNQSIAGSYYLEPKRIVGTASDQVLVSQQVRVYVQAGNELGVTWMIPNYTVSGTCWAHASGYLEPLP
jgi:hypothetical protein